MTLPQETIEKYIPLSVEIVDLTIDMLSADARRSYMERAIAKLIASKNTTTTGATEWAEKAQPVIELFQHIYDCYGDEWTEDNKSKVETALAKYKEVSK